jgi:hypothetical protein
VTAGPASGDVFLADSESAVATFVASRPEYAVDATQPAYRGGTNRVTFGARAGVPVVLKFFVRDWRWRNERFCLRHYAPTGCVPRVLDEAPRLLVLVRLPGSDLDVAGLSPDGVAALSRGVGRALARLATTPLPADSAATGEAARPRGFDRLPWDQDRREVVEGYLARCRRIQRDVPAYGDPFLARSLDLLEARLDGFDHQRRVLFHEDVANLRTDGARFVGFYDLEMCRLGTEAMQLGVALGLCGRPAGLAWPALVAGYGAAAGRPPGAEDQVTALAMHRLYHWIRVCRWGAWDGDPAATDLRRASEADAGWHRRAMAEACRVVRDLPAVAAWFGSA